MKPRTLAAVAAAAIAHAVAAAAAENGAGGIDLNCLLFRGYGDSSGRSLSVQTKENIMKGGMDF
jgi:hypothetical protein